MLWLNKAPFLFPGDGFAWYEDGRSQQQALETDLRWFVCRPVPVGRSELLLGVLFGALDWFFWPPKPLTGGSFGAPDWLSFGALDWLLWSP